jgi:CubicO group peptidase (beta-lactamase class C family)
MRGPSALQRLLDEGVSQSIFPSAQATVLLHGSIAFQGTAGRAQRDTLFDLASLTKVICTTATFISLWVERKVEPDTPIAAVLPSGELAKAQLTWADLLYHRSGLPSFIPFFASAFRSHPEMVSPRCLPDLRRRAREEVMRRAQSVPLERGPRKSMVYSDVGFLLLGDALERLTGLPLDAVYESRVGAPLGLSARFHRVSSPKGLPPAAPTGTLRPREPAPGQEGLWDSVPSGSSRPGEVDDDNAYAMDGVAGHAGLFAPSDDVAKFGQAVLEDSHGAGRLAPRGLWERALLKDSTTPHSTRALGFDTPGLAEGAASAGRFIGRSSPGAVGHTGFTGTSLWIDLARHLVVALNTNRTSLGRANLAIREFRPRFHDAVVEELKLER